IMVGERDPRCKFITIHPETAETDPALLRHVTKEHEGFAGVYAAVIKEGPVRKGDAIALAN
ncbi:MAG: MOSC domain-containing protein, partial [Rhodospirillaceae bacterium]|nr:MOSC domain-containing protein [Rhodospirillaceae bacterium]